MGVPPGEHPGEVVGIHLAVESGLDRPETDPSKGMTQTRDDGMVVNDAETLVPNLDAPDPTVTRERGVTPPGRDEQRNE